MAIDTSKMTPAQLRQYYGAAQDSQAQAPATGAMVHVKTVSGATQDMAINDPALDAALKAGGQVLDSSGNPMTMKQMNGGWVGTDASGATLPLNVIAGQPWLPGQRAGLTGPGTGPGGGAGPGTGAGPAFAAGMAPVDASFWSQLGLGDLAKIPNVDLGQMPTMQGDFSKNFYDAYTSGVNNQSAQIGNQYWNPSYLPTMDAAQIGQTPTVNPASYQAPMMQAAQNGSVPTATASTPQSFEALQFLLSGQGFDPATLAKMKAQATDTVSNQGAAEMSAGRLAAQRAGLLNSGLGIGLQEQAARDQAAAQTGAMNNIDIQNAMQGIQNMTAGAGMENTRQMNSSQQQNVVALQNMANTIQAMQQNTANLQQSGLANQQAGANAGQSNAAMAQQAAMQNASQMMSALQQNSAQAQQAAQTNYGGQQNWATNRAQAQTNQAQQGYGAYNTAALNQSVGANQQNAANQFNWNMAQGNLKNNVNQFNANTTNNANMGAMGNLVSLINGTAPANYTMQGNQTATAQTPYSALANLTAAYAAGQGATPGNALPKQVGQ